MLAYMLANSATPDASLDVLHAYMYTCTFMQWYGIILAATLEATGDAILHSTLDATQDATPDATLAATLHVPHATVYIHPEVWDHH